MAKISRLAANFLAFALNSTAGERTVFGDPATSDTLDANMNTDFLRGWGIVGPSEFPTKQDFNAMGFTLGQALAYLHQMGIAEWNVNQEYHEGAISIGSDFNPYKLVVASDTGTDPVTDGPVGTTWVKVGAVKTTIVSASDPTWVPTTGAVAIKFTAIGAGGGSGGIDGQGAGTAAISAPGGGGGTSIKTTNQVEASYTIVVGAGGSGGASGDNNGSAGGSTSVSSVDVNITGAGGIGGTGMTGTASFIGGGIVFGGSAFGGDTNLRGDSVPEASVGGGQLVNRPPSGTSILGGSMTTGSNLDGADATTNGAGGGSCNATATATDYSGGDGGDGVVIIEESF